MNDYYWPQRRVLVTGGAGFIGTHLVRRLLSLGAVVRVADNLVRSRGVPLLVPAGAEFVQADLTDPSACPPLCESIEIVFHLASRVGSFGVYVERPLEVLAANLRIDSNLFAAAHAAGVARFVYASSVFVYPAEKQAAPDAPPLREEDCYPANPPISYGWAKLVGEKLAEYASTQGAHFCAAVLRLMGVYGPGQDFDLRTGSIIPVLVRRAIEWPALPFVIRGNGLESRSYCFVDDVIDAMLRAAEKLGHRPTVGPLNVGSEKRVRIVDVAGAIIALSGKPIEIEFLPGHPAPVWGQAIDCSAARRELDGWAATISLQEGLARVFEDIAGRLTRARGGETVAKGETV